MNRRCRARAAASASFQFPPGKSFLQSLNEGREEDDRKNNTRRGQRERGKEAIETKGLRFDFRGWIEEDPASDSDKWDRADDGGHGDDGNAVI